MISQGIFRVSQLHFQSLTQFSLGGNNQHGYFKYFESKVYLVQKHQSSL